MPTNDTLVVAGIQMNVCDGCLYENIGKLYTLTSMIDLKSVDLVALPELWCCGYTGNYEKQLNVDALNAMKDISKRTNSLIVGSIPWLSRENGKVYNRLYIVYRGRVEAFYDKLHLFRPFREHTLFEPGNKLVTVDYKGFRLGFAICYDLRFPDIFISYRAKNVDLVVVPSAWGKPRLHQWLSITTAEASIAQLYLLAVNRTGPSKVGEDFAGHSVLIDAWGDTITRLGFEEGVLIGSVKKSRIMDARNKLPIYDDRRENTVYGSVSSHEIKEIRWEKK